MKNENIMTLAIDGGPAVRTEPFPAWPHFIESDAAAAADVIRSGKVNYWTGTEGRDLETEYADKLGSNYAIVLANGTVSLELALHAIGVGPGDEVVTTPRTFLASASCIVALGATPVFADIDTDSQNITAASIEAVCTDRTKAIIPVHLAGWPCEMDEIMALAGRRGLIVIEDCAQAHGATYRGRPVGSIGHFGSFSFCQDKILTTGGEGGMLVTDNEAWWRACWAYKDHGKSYAAVYEQDHPPGFRWQHESFGTNWRLSEMQAAVGRRWLARLDEMVEQRQANAARLITQLKGVRGLHTPTPPDHISHAYYKFYTFVDEASLAPGWDRRRVSDAISAEGIPCRDGSCSEIYLEKAFPESMRPPARLPGAQSLSDNGLMFMVHPTLGEAEMDDTAAAIRKVMAVACP